MRIFSAIIVILLGLVAAAWLGGETWLAREMRSRLTTGTPVGAGQIVELRDPARIGLAMNDVRITLPDAVLELPALAVGLKSLRPNEVLVELPEELVVDSLAGKNTVQLNDPVLTGRFAPMNDFALSQLRVALAGSRMDGAELSGPLKLDADLSRLGSGAARRAMTAYDVTGQIADLDLSANPALAGLPVPIGKIGTEFAGRIWFDRAISPTDASGALPQLVGFQTSGSDIILGDIRARLIGRVEADDQGRAHGQLVVYTKDGPRILQMLADGGVMPKGAVKLASGMLKQISEMPVPEDLTEADRLIADSQANQRRDGKPDLAPPTFPAPEAGELRLPIVMKDGKMMLGALPLGPAPQIATPLP